MVEKIIAVLISSIFLLSCSNDESSKIKGEFLAGCVSTGASKSVCKCIYSKLQEKYTDEELIKINRSGSLSDYFLKNSVNAAQECRN